MSENARAKGTVIDTELIDTMAADRATGGVILKANAAIEALENLRKILEEADLDEETAEKLKEGTARIEEAIAREMATLNETGGEGPEGVEEKVEAVDRSSEEILKIIEKIGQQVGEKDAVPYMMLRGFTTVTKNQEMLQKTINDSAMDVARLMGKHDEAMSEYTVLLSEKMDVIIERFNELADFLRIQNDQTVKYLEREIWNATKRR